MTTIDNTFRTWLADCLAANGDAADLARQMQKAGFSEAEVAQEMAEILAHPYFHAAQKIFRRLQKREAVLRTIAHHQLLDPDFARLERTPLPPYRDFLKQYYSPGRPAHFVGAFDHWPARHWTPENLLARIGPDPIVQVQRGRQADEGYEWNSLLLRGEMSFGELINRMMHEESNDFYLTANNKAFAEGPLKSLVADIGTIGDGYFTEQPETGHLWIGPKGTVTPLHHDLSNNWFMQLYGRKRVRMFPSAQAPYMANYDNHLYSDAVLDDHELHHKYPQFMRAHMFDVTVEAGEVLFIPIGWWHHVVSETPSISLTLTNFANVPNQFIEYPA